MTSTQYKVDRRKLKYAERLNTYIDEYDHIFTVGISNIGSKTLALHRKKFRNRGILFLKGKNTMTRKVLEMRAETLIEQGQVQAAKEAEALALMAEGNVGFVFVPKEENIPSLCKELTEDKVVCSAKAGLVAPQDVIIKKGPTLQGPSTTGIFQASGIATRINRGQVDLVQDVQLVRRGEVVSESAARLLAMLNLKPFRYSLTAQQVFDRGDVFPATAFDEVRDSILDAYRNVLAVGLGIEGYTWENLEHVRWLIANYNPPAVKESSIVVDDIQEGDDYSSSDDAPGFGFSESDSESDSEESDSSSE